MRTLLLFSALALLTSCSKDQERSVKYTANCNTCTVSWKDASGGTNTTNVTTAWTTEITLEEGASVFIEACELDTNTAAWPGVSVFFDGEQIATYSTGDTICAKVDEKVPER